MTFTITWSTAVRVLLLGLALTGVGQSTGSPWLEWIGVAAIVYVSASGLRAWAPHIRVPRPRLAASWVAACVGLSVVLLASTMLINSGLEPAVGLGTVIFVAILGVLAYFALRLVMNGGRAVGVAAYRAATNGGGQFQMVVMTIRESLRGLLPSVSLGRTPPPDLADPDTSS